MERFADKYRQRLEREAAAERSRAMHRLIGTEGFARIDTHCPLCPRDTCNGGCETREGCQCAVGYASMPAPVEPQRVVLTPPSLMQRIKAWWAGFKRRHLIDTMENHE
jgi:hypothetical protein